MIALANTPGTLARPCRARLTPSPAVAPVAGWVATGCYLASVAGANWASTHHLAVLGSVVVPLGACVAGLTFAVRDAVHEAFGMAGAVIAIAGASALSAFVASPRIAFASAVGFGVSELIDSWLYHWSRARGRVFAVGVSNLGGLLVDSAVFVPCAFGSLALLPGQLAGKALATVVALVAVAALGRGVGVRS
ncbi:VUT family protein [Amycolatopsis sp. CA-230715]|uniref:VUT family protein n=1 Tax=Amycolatopsis sp. CA-230715 TaxID=2745196 RepID=UPI001C023D2C|nr:VUT family protein [Amycolatopsis sp. CA-230715]QWF81053.1 hypothetical protein HUW46_04478 [Amycolatopsis sp. CA-230715]